MAEHQTRCDSRHRQAEDLRGQLQTLQQEKLDLEQQRTALNRQTQTCNDAVIAAQQELSRLEQKRSAAADQLEIWADRAGVDIVRQNEGADPGAVLFDALAAAKARRSDVVLVDTAGRLHNKANLMKELAKLRKIIDRELPGAAKETLLVLDATTGQNGLIQARQFKETAGLTGIVLTKLDGTAKGGIVIAIAQELQVPVKYVGLGEGIKDLAPFDAKEFVGDLF